MQLHERIRVNKQRMNERLSMNRKSGIDDFERDNESRQHQLKELSQLITQTRKNPFEMGIDVVRSKLEHLGLIKEYDRLQIEEQAEYEKLVRELQPVNDFIASNSKQFTERQKTGRETHRTQIRKGRIKTSRSINSMNHIVDVRLTERERMTDTIVIPEERSNDVPKLWRRGLKRLGSVGSLDNHTKRQVRMKPQNMIETS